MRLAWLTDIHLDFLEEPQIAIFLKELQQVECDAICIGGDIGLAGSVCRFVRKIADAVSVPLYFVLGNHDYYYGSFAQVHQDIREKIQPLPDVLWLDEAGIIDLGNDTCLIGHGGWADGRLGDYAKSPILLNDYVLIQDFAYMDKAKRLCKLQELAQITADYLEQILPQALQNYQRVIFLTHVPPFLESCWHEGKISDPNWLPHFSSQIVGKILKNAMQESLSKEMLVLCGHTHGAGEAQILDNLKVITGGAEYRQPKVQQVIDI